MELAYLVSDVELLYIISFFHDLADKLMTTDEVRRTLQVASVEMQIAAAQSCGRYFEDCISWLLEVRVGAVLDGDLGI